MGKIIMPLIKLENVEKTYGKEKVLTIEEFMLLRGDVLSITGPNGAGKTTFLKIIAGISRPTRGKRIFSQEWKNLRLCYVPQSGGFYCNLSLMENIEIWYQLYGLGLKYNSTAKLLLKDFGLTPFMNKPLKEISGGFQRIASIVCAMSVQPDGLFLDEPLSGIDQEKSDIFFEMLEKIVKSMAFVVITSHSSQKFTSASSEIILKKGRIYERNIENIP